MADDRDAEFSAYAAARLTALRRCAHLLCGNWHQAEDLTQTALVKLYVAWPQVRRAGNLDGYARTVLVRAFLDERRRLWRRERPSEQPPETAGADPSAAAVDRVDLDRALARLPPRQRAAVVLRCWEDLSISEVARVLDCSEGTVKSQTSRGLVTLRGLLSAGRTPSMTAKEGH
jgi:RNA polymerase sigma-70 factor (sigma-E family)